MASADKMAASDDHQLNPSQEKAPIQAPADHDPLDDIPDSDFPGPLRLTAIMVSLMLSIFLVSQWLRCYDTFTEWLTYACTRPLWMWYVQRADFLATFNVSAA